ncbi:ninja-family protein AFP3-like [Quillaja saponaria]|uniref:Ninja-family protein n=1 Tax=Quillaja saponaria TaxID=32244 RepID=A0AAD7Q3R3_QUISA|nr:ninja-family protein AFP3-like [Quillaja saponaria]
MQMGNVPRDLFQRFISMNHFPVKLDEPSEDTKGIELSLGLSLNGQFGIDPRANKLKRSSSISDFANPLRDEDAICKIPMAYTPLIRTCSLPTETEEEWRKRKELQTVRRMEAKRKRSEKQRTSKVFRERSRAFGEEIYEDGKRPKMVNGIHELEQGEDALNQFNNLATQSSGMLAYGLEFNGEKGSGLIHGGFQRLPSSLPPAPAPAPSSQGSIGSQGTGSSGISESESLPHQGLNKFVEARSPGGAPSSTVSEQKSRVTPQTTISRNASKIITAAAKKNQSSNIVSPDKETKDTVRNVLEDMPSVSTKGDGPNGKRVDGFLYRYRKGEEVKIVCVCHGSFLSPAEFVKHAGGGDVTQPLKHIVVTPSFL